MENNFYIPHITPAEDNALQGLTWAAQVAYLRVIRRYVNYRTAVAGGHEIRISWQRFSVALEVIRPPKSKNKSKHDRPERPFIRERLKELEKSGLIVVKSSSRKLKEYVFFLPKIDNGVVRPAYEQPKKQGYEQPNPKTRQNSYQNQQEQPKISASFTLTTTTNYAPLDAIQTFESKGLCTGNNHKNNPQEQPSTTTKEQPYAKTSQNSYQNQQEQPQKSTDEQPYIYIEKNRKIEEDASLSVDQKETLSLFLSILASTPRFRIKSLLTKDNHWQIFKALATKDQMTKPELAHIIKTIREEKYAIQLIKHQLDELRETESFRRTVTAQPKQQDKKPQIDLVELNGAIVGLENLIKHSKGVDTSLLQTQLDQKIKQRDSLQTA